MWGNRRRKGRQQGKQPHFPRHRESEEEMLELLWTLREKDALTLDSVIESWGGEGEVQLILDRLGLKSLVDLENGEPRLSERGEDIAREVVRRQRLAESLLHSVLQLDLDSTERAACKFEHVLDESVTDSVCTFLGHPLRCPHGKQIPRGDCCRKFRRDVKPLTTPLREVDLGIPLEVVFIASSVHSRLDRLSAMGIIPGSRIRLHQRHPTYVIEAGETTIAVDKDVASEIYVKKLV